MNKEKEKKYFWYYFIAYLPLLIFLSTLCSHDIVNVDIFIYIFLGLLLSIIPSIIVSIEIFLFKINKKKRSPKVAVFVLAIVLDVLLVLAVILPNMVYTKKTTHPSIAYRSNLCAIANVLYMYASDHNGYYPNSNLLMYPAAENGILVETGYLRCGIVHPATKKDYKYEYDPIGGNFIIWCPSPEEYEYESGKYLKELKYDSELGIIRDPPIK